MNLVCHATRCGAETFALLGWGSPERRRSCKIYEIAVEAGFKFTLRYNIKLGKILKTLNVTHEIEVLSRGPKCCLVTCPVCTAVFALSESVAIFQKTLKVSAACFM